MLDETIHYFIILTLMKPLIISLIWRIFEKYIVIPPYDLGLKFNFLPPNFFFLFLTFD
jgi:hypothetical protein